MYVLLSVNRVSMIRLLIQYDKTSSKLAISSSMAIAIVFRIICLVFQGERCLKKRLYVSSRSTGGKSSPSPKGPAAGPKAAGCGSISCRTSPGIGLQERGEMAVNTFKCPKNTAVVINFNSVYIATLPVISSRVCKCASSMIFASRKLH